MNRRAPIALAALALALLTTGCGGGAGPVALSPSPAAVVVSPKPVAFTCPAASQAGPSWPDSVPADLPAPSSGHITAVKHSSDGLTVITFTTATSLRDGVLFLVQQLPKAGYTLGRGDAEAAEADAPFNKGADLRGVFRMVSTEPCSTKWLLAVSHQRPVGGGTPLLPVRVGPSPSPLPFG